MRADLTPVSTRTARWDGPRLAALLGVPVAVIASTALVVRASLAATVATVDVGGNGWRTGVVTLTDDAGGTALFNASDIVPGDHGETCIRVDYGGDLAADVRFWVEASGALAPALTFTVEEGTGTGGGSCVDFTPSATLYGPGTLSDLTTQHGDLAHGFSSWAATGAESRTYHLSWTFAGGNGYQGTSATASFVWRATQS